MSLLTGAAVILGERRELTCAEVLAGVLFVVFAAVTANRQSHPRLLTGRRKHREPENQSLWGIPLPGSAVAE